MSSTGGNNGESFRGSNYGSSPPPLPHITFFRGNNSAEVSRVGVDKEKEAAAVGLHTSLSYWVVKGENSS